MNNITVYNYNSSNIRIIEEEGEPWFVAKDVCDVLGIGNSRMATDRLDDDEKGVSQIDTLGGPQEMAIINESGLYSLILRSDKPEAKQFKRWVTGDVLPSVRKRGFYGTEKFVKEALADPQAWIKVLTALHEEQEARKKVEEARAKLEIERRALLPKAEFYDTVADSKDSINMSGMSRILNDKDVGRNRLYDFLRDMKILMDRPNKNLPYQQYVERGYFRVLESAKIFPGWDTPKIFLQTQVLPKGQVFIRKVFEECYDEWDKKHQ